MELQGEMVRSASVFAEAEMRQLIHASQFAPTEEERESARKRLKDIAAEWRGFPGQRRRGELPYGVNVR